MKTTSFIKMLLTFGLIEGQHCYSQGFENLDFESGSVILAFPPPPSYIYASSAIPGWTAYLDGNTQSIILNDGVSAGGPMVSLQDVNAINDPAIQGNYSVLLEGAYSYGNGDPTTASISQTGTIPIAAQSLTFLAGDLFGTLQITFNGLPINYVVTGSTANYSICSANISAYAGQTGQLLFTAPFQTDALLDNIQFSSSPVPEPGVFALTAFGGLLLGCRRFQKLAMPQFVGRL